MLSALACLVTVVAVRPAALLRLIHSSSVIQNSHLLRGSLRELGQLKNTLHGFRGRKGQRVLGEGGGGGGEGGRGKIGEWGRGRENSCALPHTGGE